jgi:hypothetical protein
LSLYIASIGTREIDPMTTTDFVPRTARDLTIEQFNAINDPDLRLAAWNEVSVELERIKALEAHMRAANVSKFFPEGEEGTMHHDLGNGYDLKVVKKLNYKLATKDEALDKALDGVEKMGEKGKLIAERLVKFDPRLSVSEYRALDTKDKTEAAIKKLIDSVLTITPGSPQLEIIAPKTK